MVTQSAQFTATVHNSTKSAVTWSLSGVGCSGAMCGTISNTGLYTAPGSVPNPATVTVTATSVSDASKSDSATITIFADTNLWIWKSGSNAGDQAGIYGTKGTAASQNAPGGRESAVSWLDPNGNFWLFGGWAFAAPEHYWGPQNDLWKYDPRANTWTWVSGNDSGGAPGIYGTKGIAAPSNVPGERQSATSWTDSNGGLWLFGGRGSDADGHWSVLNDLWRFDPASNEWTWVSGSNIVYQPGIYGTKGVAAPENVPGARESAVTWIDSSGKLWLFGGYGLDWIGENSGSLNDLWRFDPRTLEWKWVSGEDRTDQKGSYGTKGLTLPSNVPGGMGEAVSWIDSDDNLWLFGGGGMSGACMNALWRFDTTKLEWTWVSGSDLGNQPASYGTKGIASSSNVPGARRSAVSWQGSGGEFWLFGGLGYSATDSGYLNDLWKFNPATLEWTWVSGESMVSQAGIYGTKGTAALSNIPGGRANAVSWKNAQGELCLLGGDGCDLSGALKKLNDLWRYSSVGQTTPPSTSLRVTLAPDAASVDRLESVQFHAMVHNSPNDAVTWSLSGTGCSGAACGTLSNTGLYTAPESVPSPATVTVTATSVADPFKSASATVTILDTAVIVTLIPETADIYVGESVLFRTSVQHLLNHEVTWSLSGAGCSGAACGTISEAGLYTAPSSVPSPPFVTVTATSVGDPSSSASATISVLEAVANEWAWVSGSDLVNQAGVYGTRGVAGPANVPGARENAVSWVDRSGKLWLFGGFSEPPNQGLYNDLWAYDTATREWTWFSGSYLVNRKGSYGAMGVADPSNVPGAREGAATWTDPSGNLWLFGGFGYGVLGETAGDLSDLWRYERATGEWTWVSGNNGLYWSGFYGTKGIPDPSNKPGAREWAVSWADTAGNLWLFGGRGYDSAGQPGWLNDLWKYDIANNEWTWLSGSDSREPVGSYGAKGVPDPSNVPGARLSAVAWLDSQGRLWIFGGTGLDSAGNSGSLNDLWRYDAITSEWTWMSGSNIRNPAGVYGTQGTVDPSNVPGGRHEAVSWLDSSGRLCLFGGMGRDSVLMGAMLNDLWCFDPTTLMWTWLSGNNSGNQGGIYGTKGIADISNTPGARTGAVSWVDPEGNLWLFGGNGLTEFAIGGMLNDLWKYYRR